MINNILKIKYNSYFNNLIMSKLSSKYDILDIDVLKICSKFYYTYFGYKNNRIPTVEIYKNYLGEKNFLHRKPLSKITVITLKENNNLDIEKYFKNHMLYNNPPKYFHYGIDSKNRIFYSEKSFYFISELLQEKIRTDVINKFINNINITIIYHAIENNSFYVSKKPTIQEFFNTEFDKDSYVEEKFSINGVRVPKWLYVTPAEELKPEDYFIVMNNADAKAEFVRKIGIDKLSELGQVIDTYKNYPENESWVKSEYKIIDMHKILPPIKILDQWGNINGTKVYKYAPFLYMKNQTTGVYHLEGLHPRCKTLYDALKMRYNGLNIKDFEIKEIK